MATLRVSLSIVGVAGIAGIVLAARHLPYKEKYRYITGVIDRANKAIQSKDYLNREGYGFVEQKPRLMSMMKEAGIDDITVSLPQRVAPNYLDSSCCAMKNFGAFGVDARLTGAQLDILHQLKGFYEDRLSETFTFTFWLRTISELPQVALKEAVGIIAGIKGLRG